MRTAKFGARRNEIIDIAAGLFARNGYAATGVSEISAAAKVRKGGLYYYIGSKDVLLTEIHERVLEPLLADSRRISALDTSPLVRLRLFSEALFEAIVDRNDHVRVVLHEHAALKGELLDRFRTRRRELEDVVTDLLREGVTLGTFAIDDLRLATLAFFGLHNSSYQWLRADGRYGPQEISRRYCAMYFDGVAVRGPSVDDVESDVAAFRSS